MHQGAGERHLLPHAAGKSLAALVRVRLKAEPADQFARADFRRLCLDAPKAGDEFEILERRELGDRIGERVDAADGDRAGVGTQQSGHHAQRGGLAGAVGADQRIEFAAVNGEVEGVDRRPVETLGEPAHRERDGTLGLADG